MMGVTAKLVTIGLLAMGAEAAPKPSDIDPVVKVPFEKNKKLVNWLRDPSATNGDGGCLAGEQCKL